MCLTLGGARTQMEALAMLLKNLDLASLNINKLVKLDGALYPKTLVALADGGAGDAAQEPGAGRCRGPHACQRLARSGALLLSYYTLDCTLDTILWNLELADAADRRPGALLYLSLYPVTYTVDTIPWSLECKGAAESMLINGSRGRCACRPASFQHLILRELGPQHVLGVVDV